MIPVAKPDIGEAELKQVEETFESGWIGLGPKVEEFESRFADQFGYDYVIGTNSGTSALDLALKVLQPSGSEVLVPPLTWVSTAFAGVYNGFNIGWVDVRRDTLNMDPEALRNKISEETAAVIPVHYGGQPAEIDEIVDIAHRYDAAVVEDCAHAVGTQFHGGSIGQFGDIGCFSFQATKPMTMGEGGALVTDKQNIASRAKSISKLGVDQSTHDRTEQEGYSWYYQVKNIGYKYFMHDISAGIGLAQLDRLADLRARRNEIAETFEREFGKLDWVSPLHTKEDVTHARYNYTVRVPKDHRDAVIAHLGERDVGASVHYMPLYKHPVFEGHNPDLSVTEDVWKQIVTLPMSSTFSDDDVSTVVEAVRSYDDGHRNGLTGN